jgi:hypothetical protein
VGRFKLFLNDIKEETTSADIATVDNKLDMVKRYKHTDKGKKCKIHGRKNCQECDDYIEESKWK